MRIEPGVDESHITLAEQPPPHNPPTSPPPAHDGNVGEAQALRLRLLLQLPEAFQVAPAADGGGAAHGDDVRVEVPRLPPQLSRQVLPQRGAAMPPVLFLGHLRRRQRRQRRAAGDACE